MDFVLTYRGPLASGGGPGDKHRIRLALHQQLEELCRWSEQFGPAAQPDLPVATLRGRRAEVDQDSFFAVRIGDVSYVPLVCRSNYMACSVDITLLRRETAGAIVQGGDLDNRLKTLFDALRMPHDLSEVPSCDAVAEPRMYCLLEDDSLITRVSVNTHRLLQPAAPGYEGHVELVLHVVLQSVYPILGNLSP